MKNIVSSKRGRRLAQFIPVALLLIIPSMVYAMTVTVTVDSATHPVGEEVVVTATVVEGSPCFPTLRFEVVDGPNAPLEQDVNTYYENGLAVSTFTYVSNGEAGVDTIEVYDGWCGGDKFPATVEWIGDSPTSVSPDIVARPKLHVRKRGLFRVAICNTDEFNVHDVDPETVKLMDVEPVRWRYKDRKFCPGGKDGFVDIVLKFKNRKVVRALQEALGRKLVNGEEVELDLTGSLYDETAIDTKLPVEIVKKHKRKRCKKKRKRAKNH